MDEELTKEQKIALAKLRDAPREWEEWKAYKAALQSGKPLKAASMDAQSGFVCHCGYVAKNGLALNGHKLKHRNDNDKP